MDIQLTWADCDKAEDYVLPNVLSPRDLVSRPDNMDETVLHKGHQNFLYSLRYEWNFQCTHCTAGAVRQMSTHNLFYKS